MLYRECKGSNPCNTNVTGGSRVIVTVHQDASGLKHIPLLTPCYIFMWANISNRNSHVGRHVLFSLKPDMKPDMKPDKYTDGQ